MNKIHCIIKNALREDIGNKDITTDIFIDKNKKFYGTMISKAQGIVCGIHFVKICFKMLNSKAIIKEIKNDGDIIKKGDKIVEIISNKTILSAERTALNIIQRLSGIATKTKKFVDIAKPYGVEIYDTRKTTPNFRILEKYAVSCGGGKNHRFGLFDAFMIKDNHISCLKSFDELKNKIKKARKKHPNKEIEIEVQNIEQLKKFISLDVDVIMLDNFSPKDAEKAIKIIRKKRKDILIEISGGINEENIKNFLILKPDRISIGSLTHSYISLDISLNIKPLK
ncbi:MAG: carboxylating nicotinate-nucleotide diphosphorylase [Elusimicrobiales bacterium]|nr:carboxylating nicotinate-nucleotide diphosphorylase [Elusimicrobiales bacterium]